MLFRIVLLLLLSFSWQTQAASQYSYESALQLYQNREYDTAIIHLRNTLKTNPDNLSAQILLGKILLEQQNFTQALNVLEGALMDGADVNLMSDQLSYIYLLQQDESKLRQLTKYGVLSNINRFNWLLANNNLYQELGKYTEAEQVLNEAEQLFPEHISILNARASMAMAKQQLDSAKQILQRNLATEPNNVEALLLSGNLAKLQQNTPQALDYYQRAIALDANNPFVLRALSATWFAVGELEQAKTILLKLQELGLTDPYLRFSLLLIDSILDKQPADTRFVSLRDDLSLLPADFFAAEPSQLYLRGALNYLLGSTEQAVQDLEAYLKLQPSDLNAITLITEHYLQTRELSITLRFLDKHQAQIQNSIPLLAQHVLLTMRAGKLQTAETMLANMRARFPTDSTLAAIDADLKRQMYGSTVALESLNQQQTQQAPAILLTQALLSLDVGDFVSAIKHARKLIALAPNNPDYLNLYAGILLQDKQYMQVEQQLQQLLKLEPNHFAGRLTLANLYMTQQRYADAEALLTALLAQQPTHQASIVLLAAAELSQNKTKQAEQRLNNLLNAKYYRPAVDLLLAHYERSNALSDARYLIQRALRQEFLAKDLLLHEVNILIALKETQQANDKIQLIQTLPELTSEHWLSLGKAQQRLGHTEDALQSLQTAAKLAPEQLMYEYEYISMLINNKALPKAGQRLQALKSKNDQSADFYLLSAEQAIASNKSGEAFSLLQEGIKKDPQFKRLWANLYELGKQTKLSQEFSATANQYLSKTPDDEWLRRLLAEHYINQHSYADAQLHYQYLLDHGKFLNDPWLYNNLANTLLSDNPAQALAYAEQAEKLLNNNPSIQLTHAKALRALKQFDKALIKLRQAYALDSANSEINYLLADNLITLERNDEARNILLNLQKTATEQLYKTKADALLQTLKN